MTSLSEMLAAPYMRLALAEVVLLAIVAAAVGVHVVLRREAFFAEALQHTVFPGVVVAQLVNTSLLAGAAVAAAATVGLMALLARHRRSDDAVLAVVLTTFIGVGVLLVSQRPSYQHDLTALLFGRLLSVDSSLVFQSAVVAVLVLVALALMHKELWFRGFDPEGFAAAGYRPKVADVVLQVMVAAVVVIAVQAVGTILLITFLVAPALTARRLTSRPRGLMAAAIAVALACGVAGLYLSYQWSVVDRVEVPPAAAIVLIMTAVAVVVNLTPMRRGRPA